MMDKIITYRRYALSAVLFIVAVLLNITYVSHVFLYSREISAEAKRQLLEQLTQQVHKDLEKRQYRFPVRRDTSENRVLFHDFNRDGMTDVAAVYEPYLPGKENYDNLEDEENPDYDNRFLAIGFTGKESQVRLISNEQTILCRVCGGVYGSPEIMLEAADGHITFSAMGGSSSRWEISDTISYENGVFKTIAFQSMAFHVFKMITFTRTFDFRTLQGSRRIGFNLGDDYREGKKGVLVKYHIFPGHPCSGPVKLDGQFNEPGWRRARFISFADASHIVYKPGDWEGKEDLSFSAALCWDKKNLYIAVDVQDDVKVFPTSNDYIKNDHVEIWLDTGSPANLWQVMDKSLREKPDTHTLQLGAAPMANPAGETSAALVGFLYPQAARLHAAGSAAAVVTGNGYRLEIQIPWQLLAERLGEDFSLHKYIGAVELLGFTLVVSDSDQPGKRSQGTMMATSQLKWGNPFTFGECYLLKGKYELPAYPPEEIWWNR